MLQYTIYIDVKPLYKGELMLEVVIVIYKIIFYITTFLAIYYTFLGIVALFFRKQKYPIIEDKSKFCIFVPCHNEDTVIASTIKNHAKIQYNPELFDVYYLADNCSDSTAETARKTIEKYGLKNFHVLERNVDDPCKKGKPHAINWGIQTLEENDGFYKKYDKFMILDADNFVDANILKHLNSQYWSIKEKKRPVMIQTYLDSKNKNNIISRGYFVSYRFSNGFFQLPRYKLGLVPSIGGTGFIITTDFLHEIGGFHCKSLVEDLEIQTIATLKGRRIGYNHNVRIYDEKPTGLVQSAVQKTRWTQGHWYIFFKYGWRMILRMFHPKELHMFFKRFDNFIYLSSMLFMLLTPISMILTVIMACYGFTIDMSSILTQVLSVFSVLMFPVSSLYDGNKQEKKRVLLDFIPNMIAMFIFMAIFIYSNVIGLFKCPNQKVWKKTAHKVVALEDGQDEEPIIETSQESLNNGN